MSNLVLRAAGRMLGLYAAAWAGCHLFLRWYAPAPVGQDNGWTAVLLALPFSAAVGYLSGARRYLSEEKLLLRSVSQPVLQDGKRVVAMGTLVPLGDTLRAPLSGRECVAYEYQIEHDGTDANHQPIPVRDYWGMGRSPAAIDTPAGPIRILGYARIEEGFDVLQGEDDYRRAEAYVRATAFRHPDRGGERAGSLAEPFDTESDRFLDDLCADPAHTGVSLKGEETDVRRLRLTERRLEPGTAVCAAGRYSAGQQALVPTTSGPQPLRISSYSPQQWASENRDWAYTYLRWGAVFAVVGVFGALATRWC
jgi:hypothetical protein